MAIKIKYTLCECVCALIRIRQNLFDLLINCVIFLELFFIIRRNIIFLATICFVIIHTYFIVMQSSKKEELEIIIKHIHTHRHTHTYRTTILNQMKKKMYKSNIVNCYFGFGPHY